MPYPIDTTAEPDEPDGTALLPMDAAAPEPDEPDGTALLPMDAAAPEPEEPDPFKNIELEDIVDLIDLGDLDGAGLGVAGPSVQTTEDLDMLKRVRDQCLEAPDAHKVRQLLDHKAELVAAGEIQSRREATVGCKPDIYFLEPPAKGKGRAEVQAAASIKVKFGGPSSGSLKAVGGDSTIGVLKESGTLTAEDRPALAVTRWRKVKLLPNAEGLFQTENDPSPRCPTKGQQFDELETLVYLVVASASAKKRKSGPLAKPPALPAPTSDAETDSLIHQYRAAGRVVIRGNLFVEGQIESGRADFAEWFRRYRPDEELRPGDVVALIGDRITKAPPQDRAADQAQATRYFIISEYPALVGNLPDAEERCQGNFVALLGQVNVRVTGPCAAGEVLVPSGAGDGCACAFAHDCVLPPGCPSLGCVLRTGEDGCVWAFVHPNSETASETARRIGKLEARFQGCEERLEQVLELLLPAVSAAALARDAWTGRLAKGYAYALPEEFAGSGSLAGTLLALLGWTAELDDFESGIATVSAQVLDKTALERRTQQQRKIFARLNEANEHYQRKLWPKMLQLPMKELDRLAEEALRLYSGQAGGPSAGRLFETMLDQAIDPDRAPPEPATSTRGPPQASPRAYQFELVEKVGRKNAIVVAPTGTGKTLVSALLIEQRLADSEAGLVVYCEKNRSLVEQQQKELRAHFAERAGAFAGEFVGGYIGGKFMPEWGLLCKMHAIVVLTVDVLFNRLEAGEASLNDVAMLVLDECHSTTGEHSYNKVCQLIKARAGRKVPQIVGLTATPACKDTPERTRAALEVLSDNMSGAEIVQVEDNEEELSRFVNVVEEKSHLLRMRSDDKDYLQALPRVMDRIERLVGAPPFEADVAAAQAAHSAAEQLRGLRELRGIGENSLSSQYVEKLKKLQATFAADPLKRTCLRLLGALNQAQRTARDVGFESAQAVLGIALYSALEDLGRAGDAGRAGLEAVQAVLRSPVCEPRFVEPLLRQYPLSSRGAPVASSPKLARLVEILLEHEPADPSAAHSAAAPSTSPLLQCIVFVKTRDCVRRVVQFIESHPQLASFVRPAAFVGHKEMSARVQEAARKDFEEGRTNLLVATSVAEEGLNVTAVMLGVMIDSVTSGRALAQCKGRVRMRGGSFHVLMWESTREVVHAVRSQQQVAALTSTLAGLAVMQTLETMKMKRDRVREFACVHTQLPVGGFKTTGTLVLLTGETLQEVATASTKKKGRDMVAWALLAKLGIHD